TQRNLALLLLPGTSMRARQALQAAIDYEEAATALVNAFRRFLAYTVQQHGSVIKASSAVETPELADLAPRIGELVQRAMDAVAKLDNAGLSNETAQGFRLFARRLTS